MVLEFDKRGGFLSEGHDAYGRFRVEHGDAEAADWASVVDGWVAQAAGRYQGMRGGLAGSHGSGGQGFGSHGGPGYGGRGHGGHGAHGRGKGGAGAAAAGVAGGLVGGTMLGGAAEEIFEDDGGGDFEE